MHLYVYIYIYMYEFVTCVHVVGIFNVFSIFHSSEAWAELHSRGVRCFVSVVLGRFTTIPGIQQ